MFKLKKEDENRGYNKCENINFWLIISCIYAFKI
jgi:hypothetical protein